MDLTTEDSVLLAEDNEDDVALVRACLGDPPSLEVCASVDEGERLLARGFVPAVALADLSLGAGSGLDIVRRLRTLDPPVPVLVLTGHASADVAVEALRAGADDFLTKPFPPALLRATVARLLKRRRLLLELERLRHLRAEGRPPVTLGESPAAKAATKLITRAAPTEVTVLVTGESGTGKERAARELHHRSGRKGPFVAVNCAAIPAELFEAELFGHKRGAFTDAKAARRGLMAEADGGTLFLDEVGELPIDVQPKLLRALQERVIRPVGAGKEQSVDVRVVAATNRDLRKQVEAGEFREDLYYRINVVSVELPPLRERQEDVLLLAQHFIQRSSVRHGRDVRGLDELAANCLQRYEWPGNIRELENTMDRAVALSRYTVITADDLPRRMHPDAQAKGPLGAFDERDPTDLPSLREVERRHLLRVLEHVGNSRSRAAAILGVDRRTLCRKMTRFDVEIGGTGTDEEEVEGVSGPSRPSQTR